MPLMIETVIDPVAIGDEAEVLTAITAKEAALAIWRRPLPASLADAVASVSFDDVDDVETAIALPARAPAIAAIMVAGGYEASVASALALDIAALADRLGALAGAAQLRFRLDVVETDACRRFHADYMTLRLLTTYRGRATHWCRADEPKVVRTMKTGDVAILKGRVLLDPPTVLHRSPPIEATGEQRLLLVLDPILKD